MDIVVFLQMTDLCHCHQKWSDIFYTTELTKNNEVSFKERKGIWWQLNGPALWWGKTDRNFVENHNKQAKRMCDILMSMTRRKQDDLITALFSNFNVSPSKWNESCRNPTPHCALFEEWSFQLLINAVSLSERIEILASFCGFNF